MTAGRDMYPVFKKNTGGPDLVRLGFPVDFCCHLSDNLCTIAEAYISQPGRCYPHSKNNLLTTLVRQCGGMIVDESHRVGAGRKTSTLDKFCILVRHSTCHTVSRRQLRSQ